MTPAYGNIADLADATLYALEGEFGEAAWSSAAAIPVIGQMVTGRRALKAAKEAGEEIITFYRGVDEWFPGKMVKEGKFVGARHSQWDPNVRDYILPKGSISVGTEREAKEWIKNVIWGKQQKKLKHGTGVILEFEMPKSIFMKMYKSKKLTDVSDFSLDWHSSGAYIFHEGIPKGFLKKVHKQ